MSLRHDIAMAPRGQCNRYPEWVAFECRRLYRNGTPLSGVADQSGVSLSTLDSWRQRSYPQPWDEPIKPLEQPKRSRLVMPADAAGCLVAAAELLWLARGCRP